MATKFHPYKPEDITRLLEASEQDDEEPKDNFGDESDIELEDCIEEREEGSETEQEGSDESEDDIEEDCNFYLGKDKLTKWFKTPRKNILSHDIVPHIPAVAAAAKFSDTPIECWNCLFTDDILIDIVMYTNQYIDTIRASFSRERDAKQTDLVEIRAFIGLLYLGGVYKVNRLSLEDLWGTDGDGIAKFSLVMGIKRFKFLIRCIRFDDMETRFARKNLDQLAPIRDVFTKFVNNCKECYCTGETVTIDEMLPAFRGKCPFKQFIPSKNSRYGIKIFSLVDAKTLYSFNLEIYTGKQTGNKASDVVKRLTEPLFGSGRIITADNWFTEVSLINELRQERLSYVGTIRKTHRELPHSFIVTDSRAQYSSKFGFSSEGNTLVSYVPRKNKNVLLVSSLHNEPTIDASTGEKRKPDILSFYDSTKLGVDIVDKMCGSYDVARKVNRWPLVIFFTMLNIGSINSQIIFTSNGGNLKRKLFIKQLANELVLAQIAQRNLISNGLPCLLQQRLKRFTPAPEQPVCDDGSRSQKRRRCETCRVETGKRRLSQHECKKCHHAICLQHAVFMCYACFKGELEQQISSDDAD